MIHIMTIIITATIMALCHTGIPIITLVPIRLLTLIIPTRTLTTILTQQVVGNETCPRIDIVTNNHTKIFINSVNKDG
jgi:hypothetical protein